MSPAPQGASDPAAGGQPQDDLLVGLGLGMNSLSFLGLPPHLTTAPSTHFDPESDLEGEDVPDQDAAPEDDLQEDEEEVMEDEECYSQEFPSHLELRARIQKTLYYGNSVAGRDSDQPRNVDANEVVDPADCDDEFETDSLCRLTYDRFSASMTQFCVDRFSGVNPDQGLDRLNILRAAEMTKVTCATPTSLILALIYLDRLRTKNPAYLHKVSSTDLFLVSLMVASKYLHDDGEDDEVFASDWAKAGKMEKTELADKEIDFLCAIDWAILVDKFEFEAKVKELEMEIAIKEVEKRGWLSYTDLMVLTRRLKWIKLMELIYECTLKVTVVCATAYAASLMTLLGTVCILHKTSPALFTPTSRPSSPSNSPSGPHIAGGDARNVTLEELTSASQFLLESASEIDLDLDETQAEGPRSLVAIENRLFGHDLTFDMDKNAHNRHDSGGGRFSSSLRGLVGIETKSNDSDAESKSLIDRITDGLSGFHPHSTTSALHDRIPLLINPFETGEILRALRKRARDEIWGSPSQCVKGQGRGHEQCSRSPFGDMAGLLRPVTGFA